METNTTQVPYWKVELCFVLFIFLYIGSFILTKGFIILDDNGIPPVTITAEQVPPSPSNPY